MPRRCNWAEMATLKTLVSIALQDFEQVVPHGERLQQLAPSSSTTETLQTPERKREAAQFKNTQNYTRQSKIKLIYNMLRCMKNTKDNYQHQELQRHFKLRKAKENYEI